MRITLEVVVKLNAVGRWVAYLMTASRVVDSATFATEEEAEAWALKRLREGLDLKAIEPCARSDRP
jgi:hypothetical protein